MYLTLWYLICGHALADFALQGDRMARGKHWDFAEPYVPWYYWMATHCLIQGGMVTLITGSVWLGVIETLIHFVIDCSKCRGWLNIHEDQFLHLMCKCFYVI